MHALVIGGGIAGLSSAWYLAQAGWEVDVLEKGDLTDNCSIGNMGDLCPSHFVPLAAPGMIEQGILWMFDVKSPFYIRPSLRPDFLRWGWRFMRSCTPAHAARSAQPLLDLMLMNKVLVKEWAESMEFGLEEKGCLMYFRTAKMEKEEIENAKRATDIGLYAPVLSREEVHELEPQLQPDVRGAVWFKDDAHLDPNALMRNLSATLGQKGVRIHRNHMVDRIERQGGKISAVWAGDRRFEADVYVLAAGSWSPQLAKMMDEHLDLMPGKGYTMTIDTQQPVLNHPCILLEAKVALTPWKGRLRIGSTMEIGGINKRIVFSRVQGILEAVPKYLPGILQLPNFRQLADLEQLKRVQQEKIWFGFRPVSHDGLPYIGRSRRNQNLIMATGHAMLGMSMGAATGKLVAEIAGEKPCTISVAAFDPAR